MASALRGGNTGVFIAYNSVEKGYSPGSDQATTYRNLSFDLSRVSSIYFGSKMQSKALQTLPCIKFWYKPERIKILAVARILNRLRKNLMQKSWLSKHELRSIAPFRQTESCCRWYRFLWNYHREKSIELFPLHRFWNRCFHRCLVPKHYGPLCTERFQLWNGYFRKWCAVFDKKRKPKRLRILEHGCISASYWRLPSIFDLSARSKGANPRSANSPVHSNLTADTCQSLQCGRLNSRPWIRRVWVSCVERKQKVITSLIYVSNIYLSR